MSPDRIDDLLAALVGGLDVDAEDMADAAAAMRWLIARNPFLPTELQLTADELLTLAMAAQVMEQLLDRKPEVMS